MIFPYVPPACVSNMLPALHVAKHSPYFANGQSNTSQAERERAVRAKALLSHACIALFSACATPCLHEASPCTHYQREARIPEGWLSSKAEAEADNDDDSETKRNETNRSWRWLCLSQRSRRSVHVDVCWRTVALLIACCVCETPQRVS